VADLSYFSRHKVAVAIAAAVVVVLLAVPLTAYVIVPLFVRSTVVETAPGAAASPVPGFTASGLGILGGTPTPDVSGSKPNPTLVAASGSLRRINPVDFGSGKVLILQVGSQRFLRFEKVEIAAAPNMHAYLSNQIDGSPGNFTDLGPLKATSGSFNYEIPAGIELTNVKSVVAWCLQFKTTVTYAVLAPG
jgi:hypothetical protein